MNNLQKHNSLSPANSLNLQSLNLGIIPLMTNAYSGDRISENTQKAYNYTALQFNDYLAKTNQGIDVVSIHAFLQSLNLAPNSVNLKADALRRIILAQPGYKNNSFLQRLVKDEFKSAYKKFKPDKAVYGDKYLQIWEVDQLEEYAKSKRKPQLAIIIEALYQTGCRVSEFINIKNEHIRPTDDEILITIVGKGNKGGTVSMQADLYSKSRDCFSSSEYVFCNTKGKRLDRHNLYRNLNNLGRLVLGKSNVGPHMFRHSFAMRLIEVGYSIQDVQEALRHVSIETTRQSYYHGKLQSGITRNF